jgi:hypothetical protein
MVKRLGGSKAITLQGNQQLQPQEFNPKQIRVDLIGSWLEKFGSIAGKAITPQLIAVYVEALADIDERRLTAGFEECLRTVTGWPWPSTVREASEL